MQPMQDITPVIKVSYRHHGAYRAYNTCTIGYMGNSYDIPYAPGDMVHAFMFGIGTYTLSINQGKGYIGFNSYMGKEHHAINSVYLHGSQEIREKLGGYWESMEPTMIAAVLFDYLY
ncbi:hypothetical protein [Geomonas agri]|uniref:hypothetical protein n=1 Tax=Geomonas agri TaxID=2873702 RepID=UPI001CD6AE7B|nr:hypothetical protein [Geomonas agri]